MVPSNRDARAADCDRAGRADGAACARTPPRTRSPLALEHISHVLLHVRVLSFLVADRLLRAWDSGTAAPGEVARIAVTAGERPMRIISARTSARLLPLLLVIMLFAACSTSQSAATIAAPTPSAVTPTVANTPTVAAIPTAPPTAVAPSLPVATPSARPGVGRGTRLALGRSGGPPRRPAPRRRSRWSSSARTTSSSARPHGARSDADARHRHRRLLRRTGPDQSGSRGQRRDRHRADSGVHWGPIAQQNPTSATATTFETWRTTYADGSTEQSRD